MRGSCSLRDREPYTTASRTRTSLASLMYTHRVNRTGPGAPSAFRHKAR